MDRIEARNLGVQGWESKVMEGLGIDENLAMMVWRHYGMGEIELR